MGRHLNNEKVFGQIAARLLSCDSTHYDCQCDLVVTESYLYILEDNLDGTYDCHFRIPTSRVKSLHVYNSTCFKIAYNNETFKQSFIFFEECSKSEIKRLTKALKLKEHYSDTP